MKDGTHKPIFDYELELFKYLEKGKTDNQYRHLWIKKARGLGITELLLRYMGWRALYSNEFAGQRFIVVTGPKERIALDLIRRLKLLFMDYFLEDPLKDSVVLNGVTIEAFPSHTVAMRGYENFKFILLDEADYFRPLEQEELLPAVRGFIAKTQPWIVMVSTPHQPNSLFHRIEQMASDEEAGFKRLSYLYQRGIGKIYQANFIEEEKKHAYFKREYEGQYSYGVGTLFSEESIAACERLGRELDARLGLVSAAPSGRAAAAATTTNDDDDDLIRSEQGLNSLATLPSRKSLGIDIGWGSSRTAFVLTEYLDGKIRVALCQQYDRPDHKAMVNFAYGLIRKYSLDNGTNKVYIDGSAPSFIGAVKESIGESRDYLPILAQLKTTDTDPRYAMNIVPVNFSQKQQAMLDHAKTCVDRGVIAINPDISNNADLLTDLRIAQNKPETFKLDKTENRLDLFDAFRLALEYYK